MKNKHKILNTQLKSALFVVTSITLIGCGGGSSSADNTIEPPTQQPATFSLAVSDAPVDSALSVNVYFDSVELIGNSGESYSFDVLDEDNNPRAIDLLQYQGSAFTKIVEETEVASGTYNQIRLNITNDSYIEMENGTFPLRVPSGQLKLDGITVQPGLEAAYTVEFDLRKSLVDPVGQAAIMLKPRGVRLVANDNVGTLNGTVAEALVLAPECAVKVDASQGNAVYVYEGTSLNPELLGDDAESIDQDEEIRPYTVAPVVLNPATEQYEFEVGYLPTNDYTVAFSCLALYDEPETDEDQEQGFALQTNTEVTIDAGETTSLAITN